MSAPSAERPPSFAEYRLPPGRHGIPREEVFANQRWRLLGAAAEVLVDDGYVGATSTRVAKRAGVSPATFYKHYENIAACIHAAYEVGAECVLQAVEANCDPQLDLRRRLADALSSVLRLLAAEPEMAQLLGAEAPAGEAAIATAREELSERLTRLLAEARAGKAGGAPTIDSDRHLIGGAFALVADRVAAGDAAGLPRLAPELVEMLSAQRA